MADTDTAGTVECAVQTGAGDAGGCGMDAGDAAKLASLRTGWPQGPAQPAGVAPESPESGVGSTNRRRHVGRSRVTRSGPRPNGGHRHGRDCRV